MRVAMTGSPMCSRGCMIIPPSRSTSLLPWNWRPPPRLPKLPDSFSSMIGPLRRGADIGSGPTYPVVFTGCTPPYSNSAMWSFVSAPVSRRGYFFHRPIIDELLSPVIGEALRFRSPLSACSASLSSCLRSASKLALAAEFFVAAALIAHLRANCRRYSGRALMQHATSAGLSSETGTAPPSTVAPRERPVSSQCAQPG